jgi:iron complex transport system ATP-binding protein
MLKVEGVSYKTIIRDISIHVVPGEIVAIMGPNGSGKTTILKLISGIIPCTTGTITVQGKELYTLSRREQSCLISLVPQNPQIAFEYTTEEIIMMGAYASQNKCQADDIMERLGIHHLKKSPFHCLSAGERQRGVFARSLIANTPFMLLDEPTSNQDVKGKEIFRRELLDLKAAGTGILLATHDLESTKKYVDRFIYIGEHAG